MSFISETLKAFLPEILVEAVSAASIKKTIKENQDKGGSSNSSDAGKVFKTFLQGMFSNVDEANLMDVLSFFETTEQKNWVELEKKLDKRQKRNFRDALVVMAESGSVTDLTETTEETTGGIKKKNEKKMSIRDNPAVNFIKTVLKHDSLEERFSFVKSTGILDSEFNDIKEKIFAFAKNIPDELEDLSNWMEEDIAKRRARLPTTIAIKLILYPYNKIKGRLTNV